MKNLLLLIILFFGLGHVHAQITLEKSDYLLEVGSPFYTSPVSDAVATIPTEGIDQVWDYTSLFVMDPDTTTLDAYTETEFPTANASLDLVTLQSVGPLLVPFQRTNYFTLNDNEYGRVGVKFQPLDIPTGALTGNPLDSINYLESNGTYPGDPGHNAWFPMNYDDSRTSTYTVNNEFLLTVTAFAVDHVPCVNKVEGSNSANVVGWGKLSLVNPADQNTVELDVLLMKSTTVEVDSFHIGGAPFPQPLLDAFGVAQGVPDTFITYLFFAKGFSTPVLQLRETGGMLDGDISSDLTLITALQDIGDHTIPFQYFPNPATDQVNIAFEKSTNEPWLFFLYNSMGQRVLTHAITQAKGAVLEVIPFNKQFSTGNYFYVLHSGDQRVMSSGSLQVK
jgi:hypothetical protein